MDPSQWIIYTTVILTIATPFLVVSISKGSGKRQLKRYEKRRKEIALKRNLPYEPLPEYEASEIIDRRWNKICDQDGGGDTDWGDGGGDGGD